MSIRTIVMLVVVYIFFHPFITQVEADELQDGLVLQNENNEDSIPNDDSIRTEETYYWGSASCKINEYSLVISEGIINEEDPVIWSFLSGSLISSIQYIKFENVKYVGSMNNLFNNRYLYSLKSVDFSGLDTSEVTSMEQLFSNLNSNLESVDFGTDGRMDSKLKSVKNMFRSCASLKRVNLNGLNTIGLEIMQGMFLECISLEEVTWDKIDTSNVVDMSLMFQNCKKLTSLDCRNLDTRSVESFRSMFRECISLEELIGTNWNTSNVQSMAYMFYNCMSLKKFPEVDWDTSKVTTMAYMFYNCRELSTFNLQFFNTTSVKTTEGMFANVSNLKELNLGSFDTINVQRYTNMFRSMNKLESLNVCKFNTTMYNNEMTNMLAYTPNLKSITLGSKSFFKESTHLPPIIGGGPDQTGRPNTWVSTKNFKTYVSTTDFLTNYEPLEEEDVFVRGFPYQVQYYESFSHTLLFEESKITYDEFFVRYYNTPRQSVSSWLLEETTISLDTPQKNLGIDLGIENEIGQVTKLYTGDMKDKEANVFAYWSETGESNGLIKQDRSIEFLNEKICIRPSINLENEHDTVTNREKDVHYKIEVINNEDDTIIDSLIIKAKLNEENEIEVPIATKKMQTEETNLRLEFYQLSYTETMIVDKVPITSHPNFQMEMNVQLTTSFKIIYGTPLLKWDISQPNSKGVLQRSAENKIQMDILDSRFVQTPWRVNIKIHGSKNTPFHFLWKQNTNDTGKVLEEGIPLIVMTDEQSTTKDTYNYSNNWESKCGLLIESDSIMQTGTYGKDISVSWILEQAPDFS